MGGDGLGVIGEGDEAGGVEDGSRDEEGERLSVTGGEGGLACVVSAVDGVVVLVDVVAGGEGAAAEMRGRREDGWVVEGVEGEEEAVVATAKGKTCSSKVTCLEINTRPEEGSKQRCPL